MDTKQFEKTLESVTENVTELHGLLGKQSEEIRKYGETTEETAKQITEAEKRLEALSQEAKEARDELNAAMEEAKSAATRIDELEKQLARPGAGAGMQERLSEQFIESDTYKKFIESGENRSGNFEIRGTFFGAHGAETPGFFRRAIGQFDSSGNALGGSFQLLDVYADPLLPRTVRELIRTGLTEKSLIEYPYETVTMPLRTRLTAEAASGQADLVVEHTAGWKVGATVKIGSENYVVDSIDIDAKTITLTTNLASTFPVGTDVYGLYFIPTTEGEQKPEAGLVIDIESEKVETVAAWMPVTRQMLEDAPMVRSHIEGRLPEYVLQSSERQILYGDGGPARELQGIMTEANVQEYKWSQGKVGDTKYDAIRRAITLATLAGYPVDAVVLHPLDWEDIETIKGDDGHYIRVQFYDQMGRPMVWRVKVVESFHMDQGDFLVGSFAMATQLWLREQIVLRITDSHNGNFTKNVLTLLAEERMAQTIFRPQGFVTGEFDQAPSAP